MPMHSRLTTEADRSHAHVEQQGASRCNNNNDNNSNNNTNNNNDNKDNNTNVVMLVD